MMIKSNQKQTGFTLIELMVTVAIIGILSAIAIPAYNGYITNSQNGAALANAETLVGFEETYFYENDAYLAGSYTGTANTFTNSLEWVPSGDNGRYKYVVTAGDSCGGITKCYKITVSLLADSSVTQTITRP